MSPTNSTTDDSFIWPRPGQSFELPGAGTGVSNSTSDSGPQFTPGAANPAQQVRCNHAGLGQLFGSQVTGDTVNMHGQLGRFKRRQVLGQQGRDDTSQNITCSASRQATVAGIVHPQSLAVGDDRPLPL